MENGKINFVKISFPLPPGSEYTKETIWASSVRDNIYCVENSPFSLYGISYKDLISAKHQDGELFFDKIQKKSGHSTYRIVIKNTNRIDEILKSLIKSDVTFESSSINCLMYVLDIPRKKDVAEIYSVLEALERDGLLVFEEADY